MTQTPEKVIKIQDSRTAVSELDQSENHIFIATRDGGETLSYSFDVKGDANWLEMALLLGYIELVKDRITCVGGCIE